MARIAAFDTADSLRAAQMYYVQDLTMDAIARELQTSRSTVSRLLASARENGLVQVHIRPEHGHVPDLEQTLRNRYRINVRVVPTADALDTTEVLERVAFQAVQTMTPLIDADTVTGLAWGSTLKAISQRLLPHPQYGCTFVQLNGSGNTRTSGIAHSSEILNRFGRAFGGRIVRFPVPTFFDQVSTKEAMWNESSIRRVLDWQHRINLAIFSIGAFGSDIPSRVHSGGYLGKNELAELRNSHIVGDVATKFFRADGSSEGIALNQRSSGPSLDFIRNVHRRICVVVGPRKAAGLRGALAAQLITDLILDEDTARRCLDDPRMGPLT